MMDRLISIDPSINNMGVAIWEIGKKELLFNKLLHPDRACRETDFSKSVSLLQQVKHWIKVYGVSKMIMEIPEHWAVAGFEAREKGSMAKLMFVCGMMASLVQELKEVKLVTPREWKGQLPKQVMENRLRDSYLPNVDLAKLNDNVVDAIGIGHYYLHGKV
jgi:hypothetical protein